MNRQWKKRQGAKLRLAANHATAIKKGIKDSIDVSLLVTDFFFAHNTAPISTQDARHWVLINAKFDKVELNKALTYLYADSFILGKDIGISAIAKATINKAPTLKEMQNALNIDWNTWKPGNRAAASLLKPSDGLRQLLSRRGLVIDGIKKTTYDRIGTQLAYALQQGLAARTVAGEVASLLGQASPERTAYLIEQGYKAVNGVMLDPERALMIAQTEMSRAVNIAARESYQETGVELVEWLVADPCDLCQDNADASPIGIDEEFPSGDTEPPAHPNCVCDLSPYVVDTRNIGEDALAFALGE